MHGQTAIANKVVAVLETSVLPAPRRCRKPSAPEATRINVDSCSTQWEHVACTSRSRRERHPSRSHHIISAYQQLAHSVAHSGQSMARPRSGRVIEQHRHFPPMQSTEQPRHLCHVQPPLTGSRASQRAGRVCGRSRQPPHSPISAGTAASMHAPSLPWAISALETR